jgi:hypothetical protein
VIAIPATTVAGKVIALAPLSGSLRREDPDTSGRSIGSIPALHRCPVMPPPTRQEHPELLPRAQARRPDVPVPPSRRLRCRSPGSGSEAEAVDQSEMAPAHTLKTRDNWPDEHPGVRGQVAPGTPGRVRRPAFGTGHRGEGAPAGSGSTCLGFGRAACWR